MFQDIWKKERKKRRERERGEKGREKEEKLQWIILNYASHNISDMLWHNIKGHNQIMIFTNNNYIIKY